MPRSVPFEGKKGATPAVITVSTRVLGEGDTDQRRASNGSEDYRRKDDQVTSGREGSERNGSAEFVFAFGALQLTFRVAEPEGLARRLPLLANGVTDQGLGERSVATGAGNPVLAAVCPHGKPAAKTLLLQPNCRNHRK